MTYFILVVVVILCVLPFFFVLTHISKRLNRLTAAEVADRIEGHLQGTEGPWDWDDFTSVPIADDRLDVIRLRCLELEHALPEERIEALKRAVESLRNKSS